MLHILLWLLANIKRTLLGLIVPTMSHHVTYLPKCKAGVAPQAVAGGAAQLVGTLNAHDDDDDGADDEPNDAHPPPR